jgi:Domain of unknown function (DUF1772)
MSVDLRDLKWAIIASQHRSLRQAADTLNIKLRLDGPLWLGVQQHLYVRWGPVLGGPSEIGGLVISLVLIALHRRDRRSPQLYGLAAAAYLAMLVAFLLVNDPVNKAVADWTPQTLPADWRRYRLRWEIGQAAVRSAEGCPETSAN